MENPIIPFHLLHWFISLRRFEVIPFPYLHLHLVTQIFMEDLVDSRNLSAAYRLGIGFFFWWGPKIGRELIHQSALFGFPRGIYMDLMLQVAERVCLHEIPEAL